MSPSRQPQRPTASMRVRPGDQPDVARSPSMSTGMDAPSTSMKFLLFLSIGRWIGGTSLCLVWRLSSYPKPSLYRREAAPLADRHQHLLYTPSIILSKLIDTSQKNYACIIIHSVHGCDDADLVDMGAHAPNYEKFENMLFQNFRKKLK
jgi:hypothetical protein